MGRRRGIPAAGFIALVLCAAVVIMPGFFGLGASQPLTAVRAIYERHNALSAVWPGASSQHRRVRAPKRPEKFVVVPSESRVAYHVTESFLSLNRTNEVVGVTHAIRGEIVIDRADIRNVQLGPIAVDISTFVSDNVHRDNAIRAHWLESSRYPIAEFVPTEVHGLPAAYAEGRTIPLEVIGSLKVHGVVRSARFAMKIRLRGDTLRGQAISIVDMKKFGVRPPAMGILRVSDRVAIEMQFTARRVDLDVSARRKGPRTSPSQGVRLGRSSGARSLAPVIRSSGLRGAICGVAAAIRSVPRGCGGLAGQAVASEPAF